MAAGTQTGNPSRDVFVFIYRVYVWFNLFVPLANPHQPQRAEDKATTAVPRPTANQEGWGQRCSTLGRRDGMAARGSRSWAATQELLPGGTRRKRSFRCSHCQHTAYKQGPGTASLQHCITGRRPPCQGDTRQWGGPVGQHRAHSEGSAGAPAGLMHLWLCQQRSRCSFGFACAARWRCR